MSWSFRKSFKAGPFRINFSGSGISYSVGVKGVRIQSSRSGTYLNLSSHGLRYRSRISGAKRMPALPVDGRHPSVPYPSARHSDTTGRQVLVPNRLPEKPSSANRVLRWTVAVVVFLVGWTTQQYILLLLGILLLAFAHWGARSGSSLIALQRLLKGKAR